GAVSVGDATTGQFRQITGVAAGTEDSDAVNVAQLTAVADTASDEIDAAKTHYYSVNDNGVQGANYDNDGATGINALAAGVNASASVDDGIALGSNSVANTAGGIAGYTPSSADAAHMAAITATTSTLGALSVGDVATGQFRQITGVAAGTEDSDATNVAQLKAVAAAASDEVNAAKTHYYSVNDNGVQGGNYDNDGATGINALAAGVNASASVEGGIALGSSSVSNRAAGLASYVPAGASDGQRAAINATTSTQGAFSIGDADAGIFRQITGVAAGTADSDAVNVAQLKAVSAAAAAGAVHYYSVNDNGTQGANYDNTGATGTNAMAAGVAATATGEAAVAMGNESQANAGNSVAVGNGAHANAEGGVALGGGSVADREAGAAGYVPDGASDTQQAAIAATTSTQGAVSVGDAANGQFRQITGVAAGSEDSDAVNVAQLKAAGAATSDEIEASKTHYYSVNDGGKQSANYNNDGATGNNAIAAGTNASASGKSAVAMGDGAQAAAASSVAIGNNARATTSNSVALGSNSVASRDNSVSVGSAGNERQITNVAAGTADTDAVNVSQLKQSTGDINNRIDNTYNALRHDLKDQDDTLSAGIAGAMAAAALPQPYSPGASMVSAGVGNYRGQSSLAIGVSTISDNGKWVSKLAGTADSQGEFGVSVGVGYQW
ncbi:YadA family autotransporter adhesin, partial [Pseudomonas segetis]